MMREPLSRFVHRTLFLRAFVPVLVLAVIGAFVWGVVRTRAAYEQQQSYARTAALYVANYVTDNARLLSYAVADRSRRGGLTAELEALLDHAGVFDEFFVLDTELQTRFAVPDEARHTDFSRLVELPPFGGEFTLTAPYYSPTSRRVVVGLMVQAESRGYVVAELNLHGLQAYVHQVVRSEAGTEVFITDRFGNVVAHPDPALVRQQVNIGELGAVSALQSADVTSGLERLDGRLVLVSGAREEVTGWRVFLSEHAVSLYTPLLVPVVIALLAVLGLLTLVVMLVDTRFRRGIIAPLEDFARSIRAVEAGETSTSPSPPRESFAELHELSHAFSDMTIRIREREEALRHAASEKESMLKEIHHRVKNNLNVASSLLSLQADEIEDLDSARRALTDSRHRIYSMAQVHEQLYKSEDLSTVDMQAYVEEVASELTAVFDRADTVTVRTDVADVALDITYAIPCGIILNELISNALEHAFPNGRGGRIDVRLETPRQATYRLSVSDDGAGMPPGVTWETTQSLGLRLVHTLSEQIGAALTVSSDNGTRVELEWTEPDVRLPQSRGRGG